MRTLAKIISVSLVSASTAFAQAVPEPRTFEWSYAYCSPDGESRAFKMEASTSPATDQEFKIIKEEFEKRKEEFLTGQERRMNNGDRKAALSELMQLYTDVLEGIRIRTGREKGELLAAFRYSPDHLTKRCLGPS